MYLLKIYLFSIMCVCVWVCMCAYVSAGAHRIQKKMSSSLESWEGESHTMYVLWPVPVSLAGVAYAVSP